jgi:hypothetical protein
MAKDMLLCTDCDYDGTPDGGRRFASLRGAAFHAKHCAKYRAEHGIADDAPGVVARKGSATVDGTALTAADIVAAMAAPVAAPVAAEPVAAGRTIVIDGVTYRA